MSAVDEEYCWECGLWIHFST